MDKVPFQTFAVVGIFPFKILPLNNIKISKKSHIWSLALFIIVILISIYRSYYYFNWDPDDNYLDKVLTQLEPNIALFRILLTFLTVIQGKSIKRLKSSMKLLLESSSKHSNDTQMKVFVCTSIPLAVLFYSVFCHEYAHGDKMIKTDVIINLVQDVLRSMVLIQLCVFFSIILCSVTTIEKRLKVNYSRISLKQCVKMVSAYSKLSKIYSPLISMVLVECSFDVILGLRCAVDFLINQLKHTSYLQNQVVLIFWYLFHIPLLFFLIHLGDIYQRKVIARLLRSMYKKKLNSLFYVRSHISLI